MDPEDDVLELENEALNEGDEAENQDQQPEGEDDGDPVITFGDEEPPAPEPEKDSSTIRKLREIIKDRDKRLAQYERDNAPKQVDVGPKPTLAGCDYDEEAFEQQLDEWKERDRQSKQQQADQQKQAEQANAAWQRDLTSYQAKKASLGFADVEETEEVVTSALNQVQQAVLIKAAADPAQLIYALGKHDAKLGELAKITDPIKLAAEVARLEGTMKMVKRRQAPAPERVPSGTASTAGTTDKELARLEAEADKTGDRSKLAAYRASLKKG
jgi:hypothetical protein